MVARDRGPLRDQCCLHCCRALACGSHDGCTDCAYNPDCPSGGQDGYSDYTPLVMGLKSHTSGGGSGSGNGNGSSSLEALRRWGAERSTQDKNTVSGGKPRASCGKMPTAGKNSGGGQGTSPTAACSSKTSSAEKRS